MSFRLHLVLSALIINLSMIGVSYASDNHANFYYPEPATSEIYVSPASRLPNSTKFTRVGFTVGLNQQQQSRNYAPGYHIFAKGARREKLIITASGDGHYNTLYRLRALLAALTAEARTSPLFRKFRKPEDLNFLDLVTMIGFEIVTISDGDKFAHQIKLIRKN